MPQPTDQNARRTPFATMSDQLYPENARKEAPTEQEGGRQLPDTAPDPVHEALHQSFGVESDQQQGGADADKATALVRDFALHQASKKAPLNFLEAKNTVLNHVVKTEACPAPNGSSTIPAFVYTDMNGGKTWFHNPDTNENVEIQTSNDVTRAAKKSNADSAYIGNITRCEIGKLGKGFGTAKIYTTDSRQRWIHGGGSKTPGCAAPGMGTHFGLHARPERGRGTSMQNDTRMAARQSGPADRVHTDQVHARLMRAHRLAGGAALLLLLAFPLVASAAGKADKCVAGICLSESSITQKTLVAQYGPGEKRMGPGMEPDTVTRCYYDKQQDLYVEFTFDEHAGMLSDSDLTMIMVSRVPMCPTRFTPRKPFPRLVTESGLTVGSTEAQVEAALDKPSRIDDVAERERTEYATIPQDVLLRDYDASAYGGTKRIYIHDPEDLLFDAFYISDGKVKSVLVSVSE